MSSVLTAASIRPQQCLVKPGLQGGCTKVTGERFLIDFVNWMLNCSRDSTALRGLLGSRCWLAPERSWTRMPGAAAWLRASTTFIPRWPRKPSGQTPFRYQGVQDKTLGSSSPQRCECPQWESPDPGQSGEVSRMKWSASRTVGAQWRA